MVRRYKGWLRAIFGSRMLSRGYLKVRWLRVGGSTFLVCGQRQTGPKRRRTWRVIPSCSDEGDQCRWDRRILHYTAVSFPSWSIESWIYITDRVRTHCTIPTTTWGSGSAPLRPANCFSLPSSSHPQPPSLTHTDNLSYSLSLLKSKSKN